MQEWRRSIPALSKMGIRRTRAAFSRSNRRSAASGMLVTAPIAITIYIALLLISFIDQRVFDLIPPVYNPETYLPFSIPGIGVVLMILILTLIGAIAAGYVGKMLLRLSDRLLNRMP